MRLSEDVLPPPQARICAPKESNSTDATGMIYDEDLFLVFIPKYIFVPSQIFLCPLNPKKVQKCPPLFNWGWG